MARAKSRLPPRVEVDVPKRTAMRGNPSGRKGRLRQSAEEIDLENSIVSLLKKHKPPRQKRQQGKPFYTVSQKNDTDV